MSDAVRFTQRGRGGDWTVVITSEGSLEVQGGTQTTLSRIVEDVISILDQTPHSSESSLSMYWEKRGTTGFCDVIIRSSNISKQI